MRFLPYEEFKVRTTLNSNEVFYRLRFAVQAQNNWGLFSLSATKSYYGKVSRDSFKMVRHTWYRNSFKPVILGHVSRDVFGSQIHIVMRLDWLVFFFWMFWLSGVALIGLNMYSDLLISAFQSDEWIGMISWGLIPVGALVFGYLVTLISFKFEVAKSRKFLFDLLRTASTDNDILFEETIFGLSESQVLSLLIIAVAVIAVVYFAIKLLA